MISHDIFLALGLVESRGLFIYPKGLTSYLQDVRPHTEEDGGSSKGRDNFQLGPGPTTF